MDNLHDFLSGQSFLCYLLESTQGLPKETVVIASVHNWEEYKAYCKVVYNPVVASGTTKMYRIPVNKLSAPVEIGARKVSKLPVLLKRKLGEEEYKRALLFANGAFKPTALLKLVLNLDNNYWAIYKQTPGNSLLLGVDKTSKQRRSKINNQLQVKTIKELYGAGPIAVSPYASTIKNLPGVKFYKLGNPRLIEDSF